MFQQTLPVPLTTPEPRHEWDLAVIEVGLLERDMDMDMRITKRNLTLGWWPASPRNAVMISRTRLASDAVIDLVHRSSSVACGFTFPICSLTNHLRSISLVYTTTMYQNTNNLLLYFCHEHANCWKLILTVILPLNVIYFDGSGAVIRFLSVSFRVALTGSLFQFDGRPCLSWNFTRKILFWEGKGWQYVWMRKAFQCGWVCQVCFQCYTLSSFSVTS